MNSSDHNSSQASYRVGPRAKCDQVVYEAIAKAAEIIVQARCPINKKSEKRSSSTSMEASNATLKGNSSSRFHLEIDEVESVRSILQMWKNSLHVPLRLDLYYEYYIDPDEPDSSRKELLERWCIDYLPMASDFSTSHEGMHLKSSDDTISQLRQVVKHVVILLRVLHSLTRILPAYRLHHALDEETKRLFMPSENSNGYYSSRPPGTGPGVGGGYYHHTHNANTSQNESSAELSKLRDMVGGQVNFSFYVSNDTYSDQQLSNDKILFSSSSNRPFVRHDMVPIKTPFGILHLCGLYDESLNAQLVMMHRAKRLNDFSLKWDHDSMGNNDYRPVNNFEDPMSHVNNQQSISAISKQLPTRIPSRSRSSSMVTQQEGRSRSSSVVSEHIIHDYASNQFERPQSAETVPAVRTRISTDPEAAPTQEKRVLSGLSLALMNEENKTHQSPVSTTNNTNSHSPLLRPAHSGDDGASLRQRMALHHPPPATYGYAYNNGNLGPTTSTIPESLGSKGHISSPAWESKSRSDSPMPFHLSSTPPQPIFIGSVSKFNDGVSRIMHDEADFAPPFQNPTTLEQVQLPPTEPNGLSNTMEPSFRQTQGALNPSPIDSKDTILPPITSVDALASSPFKISQSVTHASSAEAGGATSNASFFSSLLIGKGMSAAYVHPDEGFPIALNTVSPFYSSRSFGANDILGQSGNMKILPSMFHFSEPIDDEMPFAVESSSSNGLNFEGCGPKSSSSNVGSDLSVSVTMSSQILSSLAHKCATASKLKLFSSTENNHMNTEDEHISLQDQLDEFRSFGSSAIFSSRESGN